MKHHDFLQVDALLSDEVRAPAVGRAPTGIAAFR